MHLLAPELSTSSSVFTGCLNLTRPPKAESLHQVTQHLAQLLWTTGRPFSFLLHLPPPRVSGSQRPGAGPPCHPSNIFIRLAGRPPVSYLTRQGKEDSG